MHLINIHDVRPPLSELLPLKTQPDKLLRENASEEHIHSCAGQFLSLLREHSQLKRQAEGRLKETEARMGRKECHNHFWRFAKSLLDSDKASSISPAFSPLETHNFFTDQCSAQPRDIPHLHGCLLLLAHNTPCPLLSLLYKRS